MTRDEIMLCIMHATPGELSQLSAFIESGCKAVAIPAKHEPVENAFITYPEAGAMLGLSPWTVRRLRKSGEIEIAIVRNREKVVRASVLAYIERAKENNKPVTKRPVKAA